MRIIIILIPLFKWEWFLLSFVFSAGQLPCAFVQIRHCSTGVTCGRVCANPTIFGSVQIRPEKFINSWEWRICLPKTPAISNCVRILWGMCKSDMVFLGLRCANPTRFLWLRWEGVWLCGFGEKLREWEKLGGNCERGACLVRGTRFAGILGKSWDNLG